MFKLNDSVSFRKSVTGLLLTPVFHRVMHRFHARRARR